MQIIISIFKFTDYNKYIIYTKKSAPFLGVYSTISSIYDILNRIYETQ